MALLTTQYINRDAVITPTYGAVAGTDSVVPGDRTFLHVKNGGGSTDNITIRVKTGDPAGLTVSDVSASVTAGTERMIGPLHPQFFADPVTGLCQVDHSFTTSVTVAVLNLAPY